jgi:hypothetical protein
MRVALFAALHNLSNNRLRSLQTTIGNMIDSVFSGVSRMLSILGRPLKSQAFTTKRGLSCPLPNPDPLSAAALSCPVRRPNSDQDMRKAPDQ